MSYSKALKALMKSAPQYDISIECTHPSHHGMCEDCGLPYRESITDLCLTKMAAYRFFISEGWTFVDGHWKCPTLLVED